jgi:hypothetical protein
MIAMPIDIERETLIPLREFGRSLKPRKVCYQTIYTWHKVGCVNRNTGQLVRLEAVRMTNGYCTNQNAYKRFIEALNAE